MQNTRIDTQLLRNEQLFRRAEICAIRTQVVDIFQRFRNFPWRLTKRRRKFPQLHIVEDMLLAQMLRVADRLQAVLHQHRRTRAAQGDEQHTDQTLEDRLALLTQFTCKAWIEGLEKL